MKRTQPSLAKELDARAVTALDEAREMPAGGQRTEAMNKAMILRNAAEMHEHFFSKSGAPAQRRPLRATTFRSTVHAS
jgi:hypothetical protein